MIPGMLGLGSADVGVLADAALARTSADPDRETIVDRGGFWEVESERGPAFGANAARHEREGRRLRPGLLGDEVAAMEDEQSAVDELTSFDVTALPRTPPPAGRQLDPAAG